MEEFSTSIESFWVTISLLLIFELISLILSFFIFIIIYASIVIAFLVINHRMSYVDVYTEAVVISMFEEWHVMYWTKPRAIIGPVLLILWLLTKQINWLELLTWRFRAVDFISSFTFIVRYAKYVFLLVLLGLFTDRNCAFPYPFIYFS